MESRPECRGFRTDVGPRIATSLHYWGTGKCGRGSLYNKCCLAKSVAGKSTPNLDPQSRNLPETLPACEVAGDDIGSLEIDEASGLTSLQMNGSNCAPVTITHQQSDPASMDAGGHNSLGGASFCTPMSLADDGMTFGSLAGHAEPADLHKAWFPGYFEPQGADARCGMHAINNAIGYQFANAALISEELHAYLDHTHFEHSPEIAEDHESPSGDYSVALLAFVLQWHHNIYSLDLDNPISRNRIFRMCVGNLPIRTSTIG